jgi:hypothetical protein
MGTLLVQLSDRKWTVRAVVEAVAEARATDESLTLLRLAPAKNACLLGWEIESLAPKQESLIEDCAALAAGQNVPCSVLSIEYLDEIDAIAQATEFLHASRCYIHPPFGWFAPFRMVWCWLLGRRLHDCMLVVPSAPRESMRPHRLAWQRH